MAGTEGNKNAVGNSGGRAMNNRKLAAEVREIALTKMKAILERASVDMNQKDKDLHDEILMKLVPVVLPRLTEVTGEDGAPLMVALTPEDKAKLDHLIDPNKAPLAAIAAQSIPAAPVQTAAVIPNANTTPAQPTGIGTNGGGNATGAGVPKL